MYQIDLKDPSFLPHVACDIKLSLQPGKCLVVMGENGVGKTTLARRVLEKFPSTEVSFVEQSHFSHFYDRTLYKFKSLFLQTCSDKIHLSKFHLLWKEFGLEQKENRFLSQLSGGENQALKLVLGLCGTQSLLIFDEPSHYLDTHRREVLKSHLALLLQDKKCLLLIEHDVVWMPTGWDITKLITQDGVLKREKTWIT